MQVYTFFLTYHKVLGHFFTFFSKKAGQTFLHERVYTLLINRGHQ